MKIVIADKMIEPVIKMINGIGDVVYLAGDKEKLKDEIISADILIVRSATKVNKELIDSAQKLKIVARAGVGLDNIDLNYCKQKNIIVINTPGASTNAVAEHVIGLILALYRYIPKADKSMKSKLWEKKQFMGTEIEGKTLGIIGFGRIGHAVAQKAKCLGMNVIAYDIRKKESNYAKIVDLDYLLRTSDIITLHMALVESTHNFMDKGKLSKMKNGSILINTARGGLVDEDALYDALKSNHLFGACLDVYPKEPYTGKLIELDNVVLTPHIAGSTYEAQLKIGKLLVEKIKEEYKK